MCPGLVREPGEDAKLYGNSISVGLARSLNREFLPRGSPHIIVVGMLHSRGIALANGIAARTIVGGDVSLNARELREFGRRTGETGGR